ncbi:MAG: hypothetical protein JXB35_10280 [Anaerolineae bacterium]|nr:hypothetical protein [Anaerolineae bacterium]
MNFRVALKRMRRRYWLLLVLALLVALCGCEEEAAKPAPTKTPTATATPVPESTATATPTPLPPTSTTRPTSTATPTPPPPTPTLTLEQLAALYPELAAVLNDPELSAVYKDLLVAYEQGGEPALIAAAQQRGLLTPEGDLYMRLVLDTEDPTSVVSQLEAAGVKVIRTSGNQVDIGVPLALLQAQGGQPGAFLTQLTQLQNVIGVQPPW